MSRSSKKQRVGRVVEHQKNEKTKREGVVRLDAKAMMFFSRIPDEVKTADIKTKHFYFESRDGNEVKRWLRAELAKADIDKPLQWLPVISVEVSTDDTNWHRRHRSERTEQREESVQVTIDRYYLALSLDKTEWVTLTWAQLDKEETEFVAEEDRIAASRHYGHGPKYVTGRDHYNDPEIFTLPSVSGSQSYVPYTDDLWAGLTQVVENIANTRATIAKLLGTKKGLLMIAEIGAGAKRLSAGTVAVEEIVVDATTEPES